MPPGHLTIAADADNSELVDQIVSTFAAATPTADHARVDVMVVSGPPIRPATHIVVTGDLDQAVDDWDRELPAQTVAGVLWAPRTEQTAQTIVAWLALRRQSPTTPLSDLTDANDRALRWSLADARSVSREQPATVDVDETEVREWLDTQGPVTELAAALESLGGDSAHATLASLERFRKAMHDVAELAAIPGDFDARGLDTALGAHLEQVQRSGLRRWRSARARTQSQADLSATARDLAADRVRAVIAARQRSLAQHRQQQHADELTAALTDRVHRCLDELALPAVVDFDKLPRSWPGEPAGPRKYVLLHTEDPEVIVDGATVRRSDEIEPGQLLCLLVQSGFSLPGLR
jgi:hypothetical protein